jgi:hypothetical protein
MPGKILKRKGYILIYKPDHPRASKWGYVQRSRLVCEESCGQIFDSKTVFHHKNEIHDDDRAENLVPFPTSKEHTEYHRNQRAKEACGHEGWRQCIYCDIYGDPKDEEWHQLKNWNAYHRKCKTKYDRERYERSGLCKYRTLKPMSEKMPDVRA